jgi:uncharacterized protein (DUF1778 family)
VSEAVETINMRTAPERKRRLLVAAELSHESLTAFVLAAAEEKAEQVIESHRTTVLPARFFDDFFDALAAEPGPALRAAARRHRQLQRRAE